MQTGPNADLLYFNVYCPWCNLKSEQQLLQFNSNGFWECEACQLQLTTFALYAAILTWRGEGKFRETVDYAHKHYTKRVLTGTSLEGGREIFHNPREMFYDWFDLEKYLERVY